MKRLGGAMTLVVLLSVFGWQGTAAAHVLKEDNGVSSVMHIVPYDAPVSGEPTRIEFQFGGSTGFALADYQTDLTVMRGSTKVSATTIEPAYFGTSTLGVAGVNFPSAGAYDLVVDGSPHGRSARFRLTYLVRVTAGHSLHVTSERNAGQVIALGSTAIVLFLMVAVRQIITGGRYNKRKQ